MAIDTKEKRANVLGVGRPYIRNKFPVATPDEQWRISSGNAYGGNALSPAAAGTVPPLDEGMLTGGFQPLGGGLE